MKTKLLGVAAAAILALSQVPAANATIMTTTPETEVFATTATTFLNQILTFDKFDSSLGTLLSINLSLTGTVEGDARYESLDASPATVTLNLQAIIDLTRPGGGSIVQTIPVASIVEAAAAFDGVQDFDGPSGSSFTGLSNSSTSSQVLTGASDLALFTAAFLGDTIDLELDGIGASSGSGAGNLITQFATSAGATATIFYTYDNGDEIAEPATLALLGVGLLGAGLRRRRKA